MGNHDIFSNFKQSKETSAASIQELSEPHEKAGLPGLLTQEVNGLLKNQGYTCSEQEIGESLLFHWVCWKEEESNLRQIYFFSRFPDTIDFIDANINQPSNPSDQDAIDYLAFVGSLPQNSDSHAQMKEWITDTLPEITRTRDIREAVFGNVQYRLYGTGEARSLEVGTLPE